MVYGLPVKGQANYDDELNNSIEAVKSQAELAQSTADAAQASAATAASTATNAKATADQALDFVRTTSDARVAEHVNDAASETRAALSATYAGRDASHETSGYYRHTTAEAGSSDFIDSFGTDRGNAGAILISHKNGAAGMHSIGNPGSSILHYMQGYSLSSIISAEVFKGNQGIKVAAKTGQGFSDGATTSGSATLASATAAFSPSDVGATLTQITTRDEADPPGCIPSGATVAAYVSPTQVTMSAPATATGTGVLFVVGGRATGSSQQLMAFYNDAGSLTGKVMAHGFDFYGSASSGTAAVSMTSGGIFAARFGSSLSNAGSASANALTLTSYDTTGTGSHVIFAKAGSGQSGDILHIENSGGTILSRVNKAGYFMTRKSSAPPLSDMTDGEAALWVDPATGDVKVTARIAGALKTGTVTVA